MFIFQVQHASRHNFGLFRALWAWRLFVETISWTFYQAVIHICGGKLATSCYNYFTGSAKNLLRMGRPPLKISVNAPFLGSNCIRVRLHELTMSASAFARLP